MPAAYNGDNMAGMSFEDRFGLLVDHEWTTRKNNHLKRLIKNAGFAESGACVEDIEYHADRNLDKAQIARLASCDYITDHHNVMLLGATGSGKTYLACALGMAAVRKFLSVKYIRLPELLTELAIARGNGTYHKIHPLSMYNLADEGGMRTKSWTGKVKNGKKIYGRRKRKGNQTI